jgi:hypothetical protein
MSDEKELSAALHDLADREEPVTPPVDGLLRRGRRARLSRYARTATLTAAAGALITGVALIPQAAQKSPEPVPLALAAQNTAKTSFQVRFDIDHSVFGETREVGKYDPVHDRGYLDRPGILFDQRQIGSDCYLSRELTDPPRPGKEWFRAPGECWNPSDAPETEGAGATGSPGELLAQLKQAGKTSYVGRTGEGSHAIDTYRFRYQHLDEYDWIVRKTGTVDIDVSTQRIIKVSYRIQSRTEKTSDKTSDGGWTVPADVVIRLDDFGTPVKVTAPSDIVPR